MDYFDEDEVSQDKIKVRHQNYEGIIIESWTIIQKICPDGYDYKVRCKCNREFVRNITSILKGRSSKCYICSRKATYFYRR
jgi:hypothetical protein